MSYAFDPSNERISWGNISAIDTATEITCSVWVKLDDISADRCAVSTGSGGNGFMLFADPSAPSSRTNAWRIFVRKTSTAQVVGDSESAITGVWTHLAWTFSKNNDQLRLFINGTEVSDGPSATTSVDDVGTTGNDLRAGIDDAFGRDMDGKVAELAFWSDIKSDAVIAQLATGAPASNFSNSDEFYAPLKTDADDDVIPQTGTVTGATLDSSDHPATLTALNLSDLVDHIISVEKERIIQSDNFQSRQIANTYNIDRTSFVAHRYNIAVELKKKEVDALNGLYTTYNLNKSFLWDACGYDSQVNTYQFIGTGNSSATFLALNDKFIVGSEFTIQLKKLDRTDVATILGSVESVTTAFSLYNAVEGLIQLNTPVSSEWYIYASYKKQPRVVFDNEELKFERIGKEYYRSSIIFREVNS